MPHLRSFSQCNGVALSAPDYPLFRLPFVFLLVVCFFGAAGCTPRPPPSASGALSIPPSGQVRFIHVVVPSPTPKEWHGKWDIVGERNWQTPHADKTGARLSEVFPMNSTTMRGACFTWECDITVQQSVQAGGPLKWQIILHGTNGQTATYTSTVAAPASSPQTAAQAVQVLQNTGLADLPADLPLVRIGDQTLRLQIPK